ncbi:unnamed protein product [Sphagnum troendelagicum]|uniref:Uncharacterized protein n=1 Tax=Sphagnum troendelagicum TaxID=128251 RepID=A0ABP0TXK1_9BRYO
MVSLCAAVSWNVVMLRHMEDGEGQKALTLLQQMQWGAPCVHMNKSFNAVVNPMSLWGIALVIFMKDVRSLKGWEAELVWIPSPVLGRSPTQGEAEIAITVDICLQSVQQSAHYLLECCGFGAREIYGKGQMHGHYFNKGKVASQTL